MPEKTPPISNRHIRVKLLTIKEIETNTTPKFMEQVESITKKVEELYPTLFNGIVDVLKNNVKH